MGTIKLTEDDYRRISMIMIGPHGAAASINDPAQLLIVFACADAQVGITAAHLHAEGIVQHVVFSGSVGKDSGGLPSLGISEAIFLSSIAIAAGLPPSAITLEESARNGRENAAFSLRLAHEKGLLQSNIHVASLAPATRSRRLFEELRRQAEMYRSSISSLTGLSSGEIALNHESVRSELRSELRGLHTMHRTGVDRIYLQEEFQPGGSNYDLIERAGLAHP